MENQSSKKNDAKSTSAVYEPHLLHDALVPFKFRTDFRVKDTVSFPNWHTNIEILLAYEGEGTVKLEGREYAFQKGDTVVINANTIHSIHADLCVKYYFLIIDRDFCQSNGIPTDRLFFAEKIQDPAILSYFADIEKAYACTTQSRAARIRLAVLGFLVYLADNYVQKEGQRLLSMSDIGVDRVRRCMVYIRRNFNRHLSLEEIAMYAGISRFHFSREFKQMTGQTVFEYINMVRCSEAKRLIREGLTVSETANACGFDNLSYFSRMYLRCIGELPSDTQKNK